MIAEAAISPCLADALRRLGCRRRWWNVVLRFCGEHLAAGALESEDDPVRRLPAARQAGPSRGLAGPWLALWHAEKGEWETAHHLVMNDDSPEAAWVHACLHRQEGDLGNAGYWYNRTGQPVADGPLEAERREIAEALAGEH